MDECFAGRRRTWRLITGLPKGDGLPLRSWLDPGERRLRPLGHRRRKPVLRQPGKFFQLRRCKHLGKAFGCAFSRQRGAPKRRFRAATGRQLDCGGNGGRWRMDQPQWRSGLADSGLAGKKHCQSRSHGRRHIVCLCQDFHLWQRLKVGWRVLSAPGWPDRLGGVSVFTSGNCHRFQREPVSGLGQRSRPFCCGVFRRQCLSAWRIPSVVGSNSACGSCRGI